MHLQRPIRSNVFSNLTFTTTRLNHYIVHQFNKVLRSAGNTASQLKDANATVLNQKLVQELENVSFLKSVHHLKKISILNLESLIVRKVIFRKSYGFLLFNVPIYVQVQYIPILSAKAIGI